MISIFLPWFLIAAAVVFVLYVMISSFYRVSARELKVRNLPTNTRILSKGICSDWILSCDHLYIPISLRPCRELPPFVPTGKKSVSITKIETG
jgi:hypothetical protein